MIEARTRLIALALAVVAVLALLSLKPDLTPPSQVTVVSGPTDLAAVVLARQPVSPGDSIVVCAAPVRGTSTGYEVVNQPVVVRITTDQYRFDTFTLPGPGCTVVHPQTVVTNQMWVYVSSGGVEREFRLGASGKIMLATDELIVVLVVLNIIQSAVIAVLILKLGARI